MQNPSQPHQSALFSYESLDEQTRTFVQRKADETHGLLKRTAQAVIQIGQNLLAVKAKLPHGQFLPWLQTEFEMGERTVRNFMQVANRFAEKSANFADLPLSILYELAAPSTPDSVIQQVEKQEIAPTLEAIRAAKEEALRAKAAEDSAREEAEKARQQLFALQQQSQRQHTLLTQEIASLQEQMAAISAPRIQMKEVTVEKFVVPPETTAQLEALREKVVQLTQQREELKRQQVTLNQRINELSTEAIAAASRHREPEAERTIRASWYRMSREFHSCMMKVQAGWPSPLDTLAFDAADWNRLSEIRAQAQRLIEACEHLTAQHIIESKPA